jgi:hypothetical protein
MIDVTIRSCDSASAVWCLDNSCVLFSPTHLSAMLGSTKVMVRLNGSTRKSVEVSQPTCSRDNLRGKVCSFSSSGTANHQEDQKKHWGIQIHTSMHMFPLLSWGVFKPNRPSVKANLCNLAHWSIEFHIIELSLICHAPFPMRPVKLQISVPSNAKLD